MKRIFVDSCYWIGLINPKDNLHNICQEVTEILEKEDAIRFYTSEFVLNETLNFFSKRGANFREAAVKMFEMINSNPNIEVVPPTTALSRKALSSIKTEVIRIIAILIV